METKNSFSTVAYTTPVVHGPRTINELPSDVLGIILGEVFHAIRQPYIEREAAAPDLTQLSSWPTWADRTQEYPFAESLASVCTLWRDIMSNVSCFWTPLVIWLGRDPTPLSTICQYLSWSRHQLLEIYVLRRYDPLVEDRTEMVQITTILEVLLPHVKRWKVLCMKLLHSSSLPRPRVDLVGHAENLVRLNLDFIIDDAVGHAATTIYAVEGFRTPMLQELSMYGHHFFESYMRHFPSLGLMPPKLARLALANYAQSHEFFLLLDLLRCLVTCRDLRTLYLENLELDLLYNGHFAVPALQLPPIRPSWAASVGFVDMSGDIIAEYYRLLQEPYVDTVAYTRCTHPSVLYPALTHPVGESDNVRITGIACPRTLMYYLSNVVYGNSFFDATIVDCDGLCAEVFQALAEPVLEGGDEWLCPNLTSLTIVGCTKFSSGDLRAALEAREKVHVATGYPEEYDPGHVVSFVSCLRVRDCCELAPEDKEFFEDTYTLADVRWDDCPVRHRWRGWYNLSTES